MFDLPGIYKEADRISNNTQRMYLFLLRIFLVLLLSSAFASNYFNTCWESRLANAIISIMILVLSFVFFLVNFQGSWYSARAVAESIKTICWRYAIKADPYNGSDNDAKAILIETIKRVIDMNHDFKKHIEAKYSSDQQVPDNMTRIRSLPIIDRIDFYHENRVVEQRDWYKRKSEYNKRMSIIFFSILIATSFILTIILFVDLKNTNTTINFPIEILLSALSIIFTWVQTRKYRELDKSYALASYEIGFIAYKKDSVSSEEALSDYVMNAENAFSREHTQWIARKDA